MNKVVAVGSTNPVKVKATIRAVNKYWTDVDVIAVKTKSGVSNMPMSEQETKLGAKNRAIQARKETNAWLGVGNEGGMSFQEGNWYLYGATYITDGTHGFWGGVLQMALPENIVSELDGGNVELGTVLDRIYGTENIKQKEGAVGLFTSNAITREDAFYYNTLQGLVYWYNLENSK